MEWEKHHPLFSHVIVLYIKTQKKMSSTRIYYFSLMFLSKEKHTKICFKKPKLFGDAYVYHKNAKLSLYNSKL